MKNFHYLSDTGRPFQSVCPGIFKHVEFPGRMVAFKYFK